MTFTEPMRQLFCAGFAGFFLAMSIVNAIVGIVVRSKASAVYALLMLVVGSIELYSIPHGGYGGLGLHAMLFAAYVACSTGFGLTLLRTVDYAPRLAKIAVAVAAINVPLVVAEDFFPFWRDHLYIVDQLALDAWIVTLVVLGVRALRSEGAPIAGTYLAALAGPAFGMIVDDLATNHVLPHWDWLIATFALGVSWEALFFSFAVALRNRGVQVERDRFERLAYLDGLTGVANRRTFDETLERMWNVARRAKVPVAIAMIDIDHFKRLNDTRGHQVGDECLRRVAAVCSSSLRRAGDCFARYGGEEFAAILVNVDLAHAISLAEHMRRAVEKDGGITVSIGLAARTPKDNDSPFALIADADGALYRAKREGRNCVRCADFETVSS